MTKSNNNYIWDLDLKPQIELLDKEMKRYIEVCNEKLGMVPNVILANASDPERLKNFVNFYNRLMVKEGHLSKLERELSLLTAIFFLWMPISSLIFDQ